MLENELQLALRALLTASMSVVCFYCTVKLTDPSVLMIVLMCPQTVTLLLS